MATRKMGSFFIILFVLFVTRLAWGIVGNVDITVKDAALRPVRNATITLTPEDPTLPEKEVKTDQNGKATAAVEEGNYKIQTSSRDHVTSEKQRVTVKGGETTEAEFSLHPIFAWMVQNPGGRLLGFGVGPGYSGGFRDDLDHTFEKEVITATTGTTSTTTVLFDTSAGVEFDLDLNGGGSHFAIGLPMIPVTHGWFLYPALNSEVGGGFVEIDADNKADSSGNFSLKGNGPMLGVGLDLIVSCPTCRLFFGLGYQFQYFQASLDRSPCSPVAVLSCRQSGSMTHEAHSVSGRVGYSFWNRRIAPYLGVRGGWSDVDIKTKLRRELSGPTSFKNTIRQKFEEDQVEGFVGLDVHFWGPLFGRNEVAFNGSDVSVLVKLMFGFGFVDP